jgi:hypothetical protein
MGENESYYRRLRELLDLGRSKSVRHLDEYTLAKLEADFKGARKFFRESEYRDPAFRDALLEVLLQRGTVVHFPKALTTLVRTILGKARILSLNSGLGEFLFEFGGGVGIEPVSLAAEWSRFLLMLGGVDAEIIQAEPKHWKSERTFARIICNTPFGFKQEQTQLLASIFALLSVEGQLLLLVPPAFLWGVQKYQWYRDALLSLGQVRAIISLPPKTFSHTSIQSAIVLVQRGTQGKTYMAASKSVADFSAIGEDYLAWRDGRMATVGFESTLDRETWDVSRYEPVDLGLGAVEFRYRIVPLREVASVRQGVLSPDSALAVNRTASKVIWLEADPDLTEKNNIFLQPKDSVNAMYLYLYLSSSFGKQTLKRVTKGTTIPFVTTKDLEAMPVVLPDLASQARIVDQALEIKKTAGTLEALVSEAHQSLFDHFFELEGARTKLRAFSGETDKAFYQTLPFPIAIVYRKVANAPNSTQRFSFLIELFEVVIRFTVLVQIADVLSGYQSADILTKLPELAKLSRPALGTWVSLFRSLSQFENNSPFVRELKTLKVNEYNKTIEKFVNLRNESFKGHGATLSESEYEQKFQEHAPSIYDLISKMRFLANYRLVKTASMEKDGEYYRISALTLMGDNPVFEKQILSVRTPFDTQKVVYLNASLDSLVLDPFLILEPCSECHRPELLLLDKFSEKKITYLGYESGHKPSYLNIGRLPLLLRETATTQW